MGKYMLELKLKAGDRPASGSPRMAGQEETQGKLIQFSYLMYQVTQVTEMKQLAQCHTQCQIYLLIKTSVSFQEM